MESNSSVHDLEKAIGQIIVNMSQWGNGKIEDMVRANKDAEVDALCLLLWWAKDTQEEAPDVFLALRETCTDLVFDGQKLDTGSKLYSAKFSLIVQEEKLREVMAVSGWRKCIFLAEDE